IQELKETEFKELYQDESEHYVQDCQIETDLEILIPDDYISNIAERINLYKELDNSESEKELELFEKQLIDRFGKVPEPTMEMIATVRLRWIAKEIGLEKLILKQHKMVGYFVANQDSPYYQSPQFTRVLQFVQEHPRNCKLKEKKDKLSIVFENVDSVKVAIEALQPMLQKKGENAALNL